VDHRAISPAATDLQSTSHLRYIAITLGTANVPPNKTATLNLRIDPAIKEAVRIAALREHRSVANLIELLIRGHCKAAHIEIPTQAELFGSKESHDG
jgi:hypothetical protein